MNSPPDIDYAMVDGESIVWVSILECVVILGCAAGVAYCLFCVKCSSYGPQRQVDSRPQVHAHSNASQQGERENQELVITTVQPSMGNGRQGLDQQTGDKSKSSAPLLTPPVFRQLPGLKTARDMSTARDSRQTPSAGIWV